MAKTVKRRSIRGQIARSMTALSLALILVLGTVAVSGLLLMREQTRRVTDDVGAQAAENNRASLESEAMEKLSAQAASTAQTVEAKVRSIMSQVEILTESAEELYAAPDTFGRVAVEPPDAADGGTYTAQIVYAQRTDPAGAADEVGLIGNLTPQMNGVSQYLDGVGTTQIGTESGFLIMCDENADLKTAMDYLDPVERSWYRMAADSGGMVWSEVFEDAYGRGLAVTCGKPVYGPDGALRAVVAIGSTLNDIGASVAELTIGESGYAFVIDQNGEIIMYRGLTVDDEGHVVGTRNLIEEGGNARKLAEKITAGERGVAQVTLDGTQVYMAYEPLSSVSWTAVTVQDVDEVLRPSQEGEERIAGVAQEASETFSGIIYGTLGSLTVTLILFMGLVPVLGVAVSNRITRPLSQLTAEVERISGGTLDTEIRLETGDELETLAGAFNSMTASLRTYIHDLTAMTAEKERIGAELNVATRIQKDMLPNHFPDRREFRICASMDPAREVGGDFYDFFPVDDTHLAVVMADVSGKGVPAALFMVIAKTIIKNQALTGEPPEQVFIHANEQLCANNGEGLFVTAFMGLLDVESGAFTYVNAGHNPPLLRRGDGSYEYLKLDPGFVLAGLEGMDYQSSCMTLERGDTLFLYTDGVTEMLDPEETLFGEDRLRETLNRDEGRSLPVEQLLPYVRTALETFARGAEQADDITMLGLTYQGPGETEQTPDDADGQTLTVPAERDRLETVQRFVDRALNRLDCPEDIRVQIQIAVEELFVNIASYAYAPGTGEAVIQCETERDPAAVTIRFRDRGIPFDPLDRPEADVTQSADERPVGGLGIYLVRHSMDQVEYAYRDGENILTICKRIPTEPNT